jgi:hypothetical protein
MSEQNSSVLFFCPMGIFGSDLGLTESPRVYAMQLLDVHAFHGDLRLVVDANEGVSAAK